MEDRNKKIVFGILLASVHISLFGLILLPSCFGFALLYFGLFDLEKAGRGPLLGKKGLRLYSAAAAALVLSSGFQDFLSVFHMVSDYEIGSMVPLILEYIVLYFLIEMYTMSRPGLTGLRKGYTAVMGAAVCGFGISLIFHSGGWQVFCRVIILVCRLMVLAAAVLPSDAQKEPEQG